MQLRYLLFLAAVPLLAQNAPISGWCEQGNQRVVTPGSQNSTTLVQRSYPFCTVTVNIYGSGLSAIYSNASGTPLSNPFTATASGLWTFFAPPGTYTVTLSGGGISAPFSANYSTAAGGGGGGGGTVTSVGLTATSDTNILANISNSPINTFGNIQLTMGWSGILSVARGGTGTATPTLSAGSGVTISGTWPNQTISATGSGAGNCPGIGTVGQIQGYADAATCFSSPATVDNAGNMTARRITTNAPYSGGDYYIPLTSGSGVALAVSDTNALNITNLLPSGSWSAGKFLQGAATASCAGTATLDPIFPTTCMQWSWATPAGGGSGTQEFTFLWGTLSAYPVIWGSGWNYSGATETNYLSVDNTASGTLNLAWSVPSAWTSGAVNVILTFQGSGGDTVQFSVTAGCKSSTGAGYSYNSTQNFTLQSTSGSNNYRLTSPALTMSGCVANAPFVMKIGRVTGGVSTAYLFGAKVVATVP